METNLKFNSAICTSREQSERLLALGLKKETADMGWVKLLNGDGYTIAIAEDYSFIDIPAWSLHRLIEMLGVSKMFFNMDFYDSPYEELIRRIEIFVNAGEFNKEYEASKWYLKQKQQYIITLANDYYSKRLIHKRAYDGMLKYALENLV